MREPVFLHESIENSHGQPLEFWELTRQPCRQCPKGHLGVIGESTQTITFHCTLCDFMVSEKTDDYREKERLIKAGVIPDPYVDTETPDEPHTASVSEL